MIGCNAGATKTIVGSIWLHLWHVSMLTWPNDILIGQVRDVVRMGLGKLEFGVLYKRTEKVYYYQPIQI